MGAKPKKTPRAKPRPAAAARRRAAGAAPRGSASFFLDVGGALGSQPISLAALVDMVPDAILVVDRDRRIRFWNRGAAEMFGYTREEAAGAYYDLLLPQDLKDDEELEALERRTREQGLLRNHLTRRVGKDGRERLVSLSRSALLDARGGVVGWVAILRDVTEQVRVERELARARSLAMIGELAASVAHEIKNPLAGIHGATQILLQETKRNDQRREILERVASEIRRVDATVRDLLRFSKPESPRAELRDLREYVVSLARALHEDPRFAKVQFSFWGEAALVVPHDERLAQQVFQNLFENACDAMDGQGEIAVTFQREAEHALVEVRDSGPGIADAIAPRVFDPFFTTKPRGTGLGLAICRKNVEAHGGTIAVSNAKRGGARFTLRLPLQPPIPIRNPT